MPVLGDKRIMECPDCHEIKKCIWTIDPYSDEIYNEKQLQWMCEDCIYQRSMDI